MMGDPVQVTIRFLPEAAHYARKRVWPFEHSIKEGADGSLILEGTVRGLDETRKELLSWGRLAEAIAPLELRNMMEREARAIVGLYVKK